MDVENIDISINGDRARLRADVRYGSGAAEEYWYDIPRVFEDALARNGNPWLAALLPLAATLGEPLRIGKPVDAVLETNARQLLRIWKSWYPKLSEISIEADGQAPASEHAPTRTGAFFSSGVDSFFTLLRDRPTAAPAERREIDDLITVWGFDIALDNPAAFGRLRERHASLAESIGKGFIDVTTNIRETRWKEAAWSQLSHGPALASVALALGNRFGAVYIAGSGGHRRLRPWGSHSVTDPLFSTRDTTVINDGVAYLRTDKLEFIAQSQLALDNLRVCWESWSDTNCGTCSKCLRTMLALDLFGVLAGCPTLPHPSDLLERIAKLDLSYFVTLGELEDLRKVAKARQRQDVVHAIDTAIRKTHRRQKLRSFLRLKP
jgi:hypothetical protein